MGKHGYHSNRLRDRHPGSSDCDQRMIGGQEHRNMAARLPRKLLAAVFFGLFLWSLFAWIGYVLVDPVLGWVAVSAGLLLDTGEGLANATGMGEDIGALIANLDVGGLSGQALALLRVILKPAIIAVWALGVLALIAAPVLLPKGAKLFATYRR